MFEKWRIRRFLEKQLRLLLSKEERFNARSPGFGSMTTESDDVRLARRWLKSKDNWFDNNENVGLHNDFCRWNGSTHAYSFSSGRVALSACLEALGVNKDDEVIVAGYTCVVVANAIRFSGAKPIYSDIELDTYGLEASCVDRLANARTKAIIIQHLFGLVSRDLDAIREIARKHGIYVIEDCAHATGARYRGVRVGNFSDMAFYSSEQSKVFSTVQGGLASTNSDILGAKLKQIWLSAPEYPLEKVENLLYSFLINYYANKHPQKWIAGDLADILWGEHLVVSTSMEEIQGERPLDYGARMPNPIASIARSQLIKIDRFNAERRETAEHWRAYCKAVGGISLPSVIHNSEPTYVRYPIRLTADLKKDNLWIKNAFGVMPGYWFKGYLHPSEERVPNCPHASEAISTLINLPTLGVNRAKIATRE